MFSYRSLTKERKRGEPIPVRVFGLELPSGGSPCSAAAGTESLSGKLPPARPVRFDPVAPLARYWSAGRHLW